MELIAAKVLIGLVVGFLIGLTGLGGGVLLLPILIFGLKVPAIMAVGSDAAFNFLTKIPSSVVHLMKETVRRRVVVALAAGSVPGSILGVRLLQHLRVVHGAGVNEFSALVTRLEGQGASAARLQCAFFWQAATARC